MPKHASRDLAHALQVMSTRSRLQEAREDTTCLLLCKLEQIVRDNELALRTFAEELAHDPKRAEQVMHSLLGLIVQYAERSGGFLALCSYLASNIGEDSPMPGMAEADRKWTT